MFWRFGFSSCSNLDSLLDKPNVTLEEILDEDELLQECKAQNAKLVNYLQQPRVLKRLFEHVVGMAEVSGAGGREWEEKVRFKYPYICSEVLSSDIWSIADKALSERDELLVPFWNAILARDTVSVQPTVTQHQHPLFSHMRNPSPPGSPTRRDVAMAAAGPGQSAHSGSDTNEESSAESSSAGVLGLDVRGASSNDEVSTVTTARDNGPGISVLAGYWAKVNGVLLDKKPRETISFVKGLPNILELFVAHMEIPAVVDLLYRIIQCEEAVGDIGVVEWLSDEGLIPRLVNLLSPAHSSDLHNTVSELLKAIIALSAPSPSSLTQAPGAEAFGFGGPETVPQQGSGNVGGVNNRLVRELASEEVVRKMVGFMLDASLPTRLTRRLSQATEELNDGEDGLEMSSKRASTRSRPSVLAASQSTLSKLNENPAAHGSNDEEYALEDDELEFDAKPSRRRPLNPRDTPASEPNNNIDRFDHRDSTATIRPATTSIAPMHAPEIDVTPESCTSTLVTCIGVLIELIRKNNSDYFEQYLFHTLRTHLLQRQQEIAERKASAIAETIEKQAQDDAKPMSKAGSASEDEDDELEGMEEAMAELSDKLGIVHLGPMLRVLSERLGDFQDVITRPRGEQTETVSSLGKTSALTFERYRITELYAELLHCSNMALLNRAKNEGPQYSDDGVLLGGIEGLQILARTLQGTDAASDSGQDHSQTVSKGDAGSPEAAAEAPSQPEQDTPVEHAKTDVEEGQGSKSAGSHHVRQSSTMGSGGTASGDTDDEALLSEVSPSDTTTSIQGDTTKDKTAAVDVPHAKAADDSKNSEPSGDEPGESKEDDAELQKVLSHLSLADLTSPSSQHSRAPSPTEDGRELVTGDLLKKKFLECNVVPTVLSMFFEYPWNNFLHNVVYDILQQFFNGRMDVGLNRRLTIAVFDKGQLIEKIIEGQRYNEESLQGPRKIRMGYMGHMNLIAEETIKLLDRYPDEIGSHIQTHLTPEWTDYTEKSLKEVRQREAAPLAGGRPQMMQSMGFGQHTGSGRSGDGDNYNTSQSIGSDAFANYLSSQMGGGNASSDDDDSDEDSSWLNQDMRTRNFGDGNNDGFEDAFEPGDSAEPFGAGDHGEVDDDDEWGPFADSSEMHDSHRSSASAYLTPADWAADFQREAIAGESTRPGGDESLDDAGSATSGGDGDERELSRKRSNSGGSDSNNTPFIDLLDNASLRQTDVVAAAHARRPSLDHSEPVISPTKLSAHERRRSSSSAGSSDPSLTHATDEDEPFGPGVAPDAQADGETGLIERVIDGKTVKVPLDDVALAAAQGPMKEEGGESAQTTLDESAVVDE